MLSNRARNTLQKSNQFIRLRNKLIQKKDNNKIKAWSSRTEETIPT